MEPLRCAHCARTCRHVQLRLVDYFVPHHRSAAVTTHAFRTGRFITYRFYRYRYYLVAALRSDCDYACHRYWRDTYRQPRSFLLTPLPAGAFCRWYACHAPYRLLLCASRARLDAAPDTRCLRLP